MGVHRQKSVISSGSCLVRRTLRAMIGLYLSSTYLWGRARVVVGGGTTRAIGENRGKSRSAPNAREATLTLYYRTKVQKCQG
jgi:hypothetical protein